MTGSEPGERPTTKSEHARPRLATPPSARYAAARTDEASAEPASGARRPALAGPLLRALVLAVIGGAALLITGAILTSTAGLLFIAGVTGGAIGLVLARAAVPRTAARPVSRRTVAWLAVALAIGAVAIGAIATWLVALGEGGTLGLIDYLLDTFGPFVPGEAVIAAIAAAWGANAGPVQS